MDAVALVVWIKVGSRQSCRDEVVLIKIGFNGSVDDSIDASITIRTRPCRADILEPNVLISCYNPTFKNVTSVDMRLCSKGWIH